MNFLAITALINAATSIVLGLLILFTGPKDRTHQTFFLFATAVAVWGFFYFFWQIASTPSEALLWVHLFMGAAIFIPFFYFHFIARFLKLEKKLLSWIVFGYGFGILFSFINWTPFFIANLFPFNGFPFWPRAGEYFLPFLIIWILYATYPAVLLLKRAWHAQRNELQQIKYILIGTVIGYAGGVMNFFLWYEIPIFPYGNISASIYIIFVAYAIMKYKLFNMKVIATELLVFALWLFVFIRMLVAVSVQEQIANGVLLTVLLIAGVFLIRSVDREVEQREEIEKLATDLHKANERLKELDKLKSEFVSIASHQLRSPLTAIKGYASLILEGSFGATTTTVKEAVQKIFDSSQLMVLSVEDFLNVSRIEQGRMRYEMSDFDLGDLAQKVVEELKPVAVKKGLVLKFDLPKNQLPVHADLGKIKQVISNLLDNSIKYTPHGTVTISGREDGKRVSISITDTGVGIPKETLPKLFDRFVRADNANTVNVSGTGLGLYVAKQMVEAHKGRVWAESPGEGKGSTFTIELPRR